MERKYQSGIAFRPLAGTDKITTATPEEHPKNVIYCLSERELIPAPRELTEAYFTVYGENSGIDAIVIARIPCHASQLLARELRKEGDRDTVLVIYRKNERNPKIIKLKNDAQLISFLEAHPHRNSIEVIDEYMNH